MATLGTSPYWLRTAGVSTLGLELMTSDAGSDASAGTVTAGMFSGMPPLATLRNRASAASRSAGVMAVPPSSHGTPWSRAMSSSTPRPILG